MGLLCKAKGIFRLSTIAVTKINFQAMLMKSHSVADESSTNYITKFCIQNALTTGPWRDWCNAIRRPRHVDSLLTITALVESLGAMDVFPVSSVRQPHAIQSWMTGNGKPSVTVVCISNECRFVSSDRPEFHLSGDIVSLLRSCHRTNGLNYSRIRAKL